MTIHSAVVGGLCILAAGLLVGLVIQSRRLSDRDEMLSNNVNRAAQVQAGLVQLQAEISEDKADTDRLQLKFNESTQRVAAMLVAAEKLEVDAMATQKLLDKAREAGTKFQTEMAAAKVAALEQQGKAEVAQAQADVMRVQLKHATDAAAQFEEALATSKSEVASLEENLAKAQTLLVALQKPTGKR